MSTAPAVSGDDRRRIPIVAFGLSLGLFFVISYLVCLAGYFGLPDWPIRHEALSVLLPGFELLTWPSFFLGLGESFAWGWYIALVFGPIYNFLSARLA